MQSDTLVTSSVPVLNNKGTEVQEISSNWSHVLYYGQWEMLQPDGQYHQPETANKKVYIYANRFIIRILRTAIISGMNYLWVIWLLVLYGGNGNENIM